MSYVRSSSRPGFEEAHGGRDPDPVGRRTSGTPWPRRCALPLRHRRRPDAHPRRPAAAPTAASAGNLGGERLVGRHRHPARLRRDHPGQRPARRHVRQTPDAARVPRHARRRLRGLRAVHHAVADDHRPRPAGRRERSDPARHRDPARRTAPAQTAGSDGDHQRDDGSRRSRRLPRRRGRRADRPLAHPVLVLRTGRSARRCPRAVGGIPDVSTCSVRSGSRWH